jgi:2-methylcitrate dehydratase PrpD
MAEPTLSRQFAQFARALSFQHLSSEHREKVKTYLLDWLGCAYAGKNQPSTRMMVKTAHSLGGNSESTMIPDEGRTMCLLAALVNGAASHVVEMDDLHRESVLHPAAAVLPALMALAERQHASGKDLMVAISCGYEVAIRTAIGVGTSHYHFWHTTGTCGTFGAAAGSAKLLGLNEDQFVWALGSAGTQAAGLWEFLSESAMSKVLHPGKSSMNGLLAALLAQQGFTGPSRILEGPKAFFRATSSDFDENRALAGLGKEFFVERNSLKYHASCGHTHSSIDAVLQATGARPMPVDEIQHVDVWVYQASVDLLGDVKPTTPYLGKFNLPFCIATALIHGHVNLTDFTEERLKDPGIRSLMERITINSDKGLTKSYPRKWPARAEIITSDGQRLKGAIEYPKGDPENPLRQEEVIGKFMGLTDCMIPKAVAQGIAERVLNLEDVRDVNQLLGSSQVIK